MSPQLHELIEAEGQDLFMYGVEVGLRLASERLDHAIREALCRPDGHGGPDLDPQTRAAAVDLYRRHGVMP